MKTQLQRFIVSLLSLGIVYFGSHSMAEAEKWNLGMIDPSPKKMIERFSPLLKYLESKGIPTGKVVTTKTPKQMIKSFEQGKVHFMFDSANHAIQVIEGAGAIPILIREKDGVRQYNSVIFVKKDSPIQTLTDLKGMVIAFEDPGSTSSYILPRSILTNAGLELKQSRKAIQGKLAYYFTKDDKNTIAQVKMGIKAHAGGIKTGKVKDNPAFRLLEPQSVYVPRHAVLVARGINYDQLKEVLLGMKNDPAAQDALQTAKTPTGFSEFDGDPGMVMNKVKKALGQ